MIQTNQNQDNQSIQQTLMDSKWTEDRINKIDTRHVNRTITYVDEKGNSNLHR